ncbi:hypothetical protein Pse7367_1405 [Thalassoporum mexicanum PCC 7367]|uniref:hypothetical protein n=1 Tax=Thalassoporum mexicanum TaxID=3457544 RepID=UPI00029F9F54|nr:hypothetical protein [Pseudanabaena sp. PCC 7367]AFY69696.1 hypothetical protein Pse7367_1405 [Pseudanabaena sp. PCC 7367]
MGLTISNQPYESPIARKVDKEHISQIINNGAKEVELQAETDKRGENTKRLTIGAVIVLIAMTFGYAGITKDKELSAKIIDVGIGAIGGFGAGYAVSKQKDQK